MKVKGRPTRAYNLKARGQRMAEREGRVMDAAIEMWRQRWYDEITLAEIADRSGVSLSTIMRRFGSKEGIVEAILASDRLGTFGNREAVATGDIAGAVAELVDDYERIGDAVIRNLALEDRIPSMGVAVKIGRAMHREWIARMFPPSPGQAKAAGAKTHHALLVVATDVYTWKLLRRDQGLTKPETARAMTTLLERLTGER